MCEIEVWRGVSYLTLQVSNKQPIEDLTGFIRVTNILKGFC